VFGANNGIGHGAHQLARVAGSSAHREGSVVLLGKIARLHRVSRTSPRARS
jgi:hypothetical protein